MRKCTERVSVRPHDDCRCVCPHFRSWASLRSASHQDHKRLCRFSPHERPRWRCGLPWWLQNFSITWHWLSLMGCPIHDYAAPVLVNSGTMSLLIERLIYLAMSRIRCFVPWYSTFSNTLAATTHLSIAVHFIFCHTEPKVKDALLKLVKLLTAHALTRLTWVMRRALLTVLHWHIHWQVTKVWLSLLSSDSCRFCNRWIIISGSLSLTWKSGHRWCTCILVSRWSFCDSTRKADVQF